MKSLSVAIESGEFMDKQYCICERCSSNKKYMSKLYDMKVNLSEVMAVSDFELEARADNCRCGIRYLLLSMSPCSSYSYGFGSLHKIHLKLFENHLSDNIDHDKTFSLVECETIYTQQFLDVFNDEAQKLYGLSFYRCEDSLYVAPETLG